MLVLICLFVVCSALLIYKHRSRNSANEPPAVPGALPIIGHAHLLIGDSLKLWTSVKELSYDSIKAGGVISASIGPRTIYIVTDPDDCLTVSNTCLQKDGFYEFAKPWLGEGLVTGDVSIWRGHRKLLNPAFSQLVLDGFLGVFNDQSRKLVRDIAVEVGRGPFDHWIYTRHNALETICLTALGVDFRDTTVLNSQYVQAAEEMFNILVDRFQRFWIHNHYLYSWTSLKRKQDECLKILHNMSSTVLQRRKNEMKEDMLNENDSTQLNNESFKAKFKPFMDLLLELAIHKNAFTDQEIREHVDTMIVGGHDTSASVLMYTLVLLGSHPEVQEKAFAEIDEVFEGVDRDVEKQDLSKLVYLEAILKESMRIYPIVPVTARHLDKNVKLRNCTLTAGRTCFMFIYGIHRHPSWGPDVEDFNPDRWLDPSTLPDNPNLFAGFSMGKRICIGKSYAFMSMKTSMVHFLRHYRVKGDHTKLKIKIDVMLKPMEGHHITLEYREKPDRKRNCHLR